MLDYILFGICPRDEIVDENMTYFGNLFSPLPNIVNTIKSNLSYGREYLYYSELKFSMIFIN